MSIKLTKEIDGKKVELDVISLKGEAVIRDSSFKEAMKKGITKKALKDAGFRTETDVMKYNKTKDKNK